MKILVPLKRVVDAYVRVRVKADGSGVETANVKMSINPFDEIALEEALRIKEQAKMPVEAIIVVSIGPTSCQETLRAGLALGATQALFIQTEQSLEPLEIANVLQKVVEAESVDLVIMGKQAIDSDDNQTGQMLAALLDWPQGTFASQVTFPSEGVVEVTREIDGGAEVLALDLPAVITVDLRLNTPRYATLPNIMKAKTKPLTVAALTDYLSSPAMHQTTLAVSAPAVRQAGVILDSVDALIAKLKEAGGLL